MAASESLSHRLQQAFRRPFTGKKTQLIVKESMNSRSNIRLGEQRGYRVWWNRPNRRVSKSEECLSCTMSTHSFTDSCHNNLDNDIVMGNEILKSNTINTDVHRYIEHTATCHCSSDFYDTTPCPVMFDDPLDKKAYLYQLQDGIGGLNYSNLDGDTKSQTSSASDPIYRNWTSGLPSTHLVTNQQLSATNGRVRLTAGGQMILHRNRFQW